jgi:hypothetical protein
VKNEIGLDEFDMELKLKDGNVEYKEGERIRDNKLLLISDTEYFEENVEKLIFILK